MRADLKSFVLIYTAFLLLLGLADLRVQSSPTKTVIADSQVQPSSTDENTPAEIGQQCCHKNNVQCCIPCRC